MKIEPKNQLQLPGGASPQPQAARRSLPPHLLLSAPAEEFRRIRPQLEALPAPPTADRVAELRSLIARGVYSIDGGAVAEAMLDDEAVGRALAIP